MLSSPAAEAAAVVFLLDVDNTLLDNDRFGADLGATLEAAFGAGERERYWAIYEELRRESGVADYLGALQRFRAGLDNDPSLLQMSHYLLEKSATGKDSPYTAFFYPRHMFHNARVTLNTLVSLEDAFIAAYLVGVRDFSNADLRVTAARIMGIESDHRTLARVVAPGVAPRDGGPIERVKGIQGVRESVDPPNNNGYERTLGLTNISQAVDALLPFVDASAAAKAGFNTRRAFKFHPFTPHLPTELGAFHSFAG